MIFVLSPAKTLDYTQAPTTSTFTQPSLTTDTQALVDQLATMDAAAIGKLMKLSDKLAALNTERYQQFRFPFSPDNAKQALLAFKGDVYQKMETDSYTEEDFDFAQKHLRILSGLYGVLRPLDLMQPYRLEMGTSLVNGRGKNLYAYWGDKIALHLKEALAKTDTNTLINLASNEYFKAVKTEVLGAQIITPQFKEYRDGKLKMLGLFAKQGRGMMADFIIRHRITNPADIQGFDLAGYRFDASLSDDSTWLFTRQG